MQPNSQKLNTNIEVGNNKGSIMPSFFSRRMVIQGVDFITNFYLPFLQYYTQEKCVPSTLFIVVPVHRRYTSKRFVMS